MTLIHRKFFKTGANLAFVTVCMLLVASASLNVMAHKGATGIVKTRMDAMADIGTQMKLLGAMMQGKTAFDSKTVGAAAEVIASHAAKMPELFPKGSTHKPSEALPAIWQDWDRFTKLAKDLEMSAGKLAKSSATAQSAADIRQDLVSIGATCKSCHETFRLAK